MRVIHFLVCAACALALAGCQWATEWRPAAGAKDYPATDDAFRIHEAGPECEKIGTVIVTGSHELDRVAATASRHGGTHYVVTHEPERNDRGRKVRGEDEMSASVYRCGTEH